MDYVIFASYGNDSIALIQWAHERGLQGVHVAYSDTGWAAPWWAARVEQAHRYPAVWAQGEEAEAKHGHTFRSPARDTWPVRLVDLRQRFERGDVPRNTELNRDLFDNEPTRCRACML